MAEEHTEDEHRYRDTTTGILYDKSASRMINLLNTEGYAQRNARAIIGQVLAEWHDYTDENIEERLCAALHVSPDRMESNELGKAIHDILDLWNKYLIAFYDVNGFTFGKIMGTEMFISSTVGSDRYDIRLVAALNAYERFRKEHDVIPLASELAVLSVLHGSGGKIDLLCVMDGKVTLVDYKTGELKTEHWLQQMFYVRMIHEVVGLRVNEVYLWKPSTRDTSYKLERVGPIGKVNSKLKKVIAGYKALEELRSMRANKKKIIV